MKINQTIKSFSITRKVMLLLMLPGVGFLILTTLFYVYINEITNNSSFINAAGRQRMLSQQMLSLSQMVALGQKEQRFELQATMDEFENTLKLLKNGGTLSNKKYLKPASGEIYSKLNDAYEYWALLKPSLLIVADNPLYDNEFREAVDIIKTDIGRITQSSDAIVTAYDAKIIQLQHAIFYILLIITGLGVSSIYTVILIVWRYTKDRENVEKWLKISEERFVLATAGTNDGIWDWDLETGDIYFSDRWKQMLGYDPDEKIDSFKAWSDLIHADDLGRFLISWANYMEGETKQLYIEYRLRTNDNNYKWILCRGSSSSDVSVHSRLSGSHTDISARKQIEERLLDEKKKQELLIQKLDDAQNELLKSEESLRLGQVYANVGQWNLDIQTNKISWSERVGPMLGFETGKVVISLEEFIAIFHPEEQNAVDLSIQNCINKNINYDIEHRVIWPDGSLHWIHQRGDVLRDNKGTALRMFGFVQDTTERKEAEKSIIELLSDSKKINFQLVKEHEERVVSETRLLNILDIAPIGIIVINGKNIITVFNKSAETIFGYSADEIIGNTLDILLPDDVAGHHHKHVKSFVSSNEVSKKMANRQEVRGKRKNGELFPCGASISKVKQNNEWHCTVILQDLSEERNVKDALYKEKHEQDLLIKKLQEAQDQLLQSEKMASIGQLAAGVAHEINNPVGYINSNISSLKKYLDDLFKVMDEYELAESDITNPATTEAIKHIKQEVEIDYLKDDLKNLIKESEEGVLRVKKIVQDLKEFSHVGEAEWQWADLHNGLNSTLNIVHNELKYKAEIIKEYGKLPEIECIISQLNQVFVNILVNAAHAIEERGTIIVRTGTENNGVWIEIEDSGTGMSEETKIRIFDPFYTTKPVGKGTGLGMSLSFSIIQKHHGTIDIKSELGRGTLFHIWLPIQQEQQQVE